MNYSINTINNELEKRIIIKNGEYIKNNEVIVFDKKNNNDNIIKVLKMLERNWLIDNKKTFIYNVNEDINLEGYLYATTMENNLPNDLYEDIIINNNESWIKYKELLSNKPLYIMNTTPGNIHNNLTIAKNTFGDNDLIIIIDDFINNSDLEDYCWCAKSSVIVIITNNATDLSLSSYYKNKIRYMEI